MKHKLKIHRWNEVVQKISFVWWQEGSYFIGYQFIIFQSKSIVSCKWRTGYAICRTILRYLCHFLKYGAIFVQQFLRISHLFLSSLILIHIVVVTNEKLFSVSSCGVFKSRSFHFSWPLTTQKRIKIRTKHLWNQTSWKTKSNKILLIPPNFCQHVQNQIIFFTNIINPKIGWKQYSTPMSQFDVKFLWSPFQR